MLAAWYADVLARHAQLVAWTSGELRPPPSIWLPGLFNPKACLTAVMQQYARLHRLPLDVMRFTVEVTGRQAGGVTEPAPDGGMYIHGLTLEGGWGGNGGMGRWGRVERGEKGAGLRQC